MSERKRMTATERETLGALSVASQIMSNAVRDLNGERCKLVKNMRRDLRLCEVTLDRLLQRIVYSIPPEQQRSYAHTLMDTSYTVGAKCRARNGSRASDDEYGMYLTFHQINELLTAAREKCMMCDMTKETIARCTLRKAFDEIPTDAPASDGTDCPYYRII